MAVPAVVLVQVRTSKRCSVIVALGTMPTVELVALEGNGLCVSINNQLLHCCHLDCALLAIFLWLLLW